jgi:hypothetical protein
VNLEMQLETVMERDWMSTWRWSRNGTQLFKLHSWECDKVTLPLSSHGELPVGSRLYREARQKQKMHSGVIL